MSDSVWPHHQMEAETRYEGHYRCPGCGEAHDIMVTISGDTERLEKVRIAPQEDADD